MTKDNS